MDCQMCKATMMGDAFWGVSLLLRARRRHCLVIHFLDDGMKMQIVALIP